MGYIANLWVLLCLLIAFGWTGLQLEGRLYFMHVPKTGGTTLRLLLEQQLDSTEIYPFRNRQTASRPVREALVSGHFPFWFCKQIDDDFENAHKAMILREPVSRYLSLLRAKKKADRTLPDIESVMRLRLQPNNRYAEGMVDNALCRYLSDDPNLRGDALLQSAAHNLEKVDYLLFFDNYTEDVTEFFRQLQIEIEPQDIPKINTTAWEPISAELLEEVRQHNELDIRLYAYAKEHLVKRDASYPLRTPSYAALVQPQAEVDYTFDMPLNGRGWTYRETIKDAAVDYPTCRWVMDYPADVSFSLVRGGDYQLIFDARPLTREIVPKVSVNGHEIALAQMTNDVFSSYLGMIPQELLCEGSTRLSFYSDKAVEYRDIYPSHYNQNHPPLAFAVNRIRLSLVQ